MAIAKRLGTNAVTVAQGLLDRLEELKKEVIPPYIQVKVTRNYGQTANEKVNELIRELLIVVLSITVLLTLFLGWREALIVALAVPVTSASPSPSTSSSATPSTASRSSRSSSPWASWSTTPSSLWRTSTATLPLRQHPPPARPSWSHGRGPCRPLILATLAVVVAFLPMFFITGMMGPYMRPMALNVPVAMLMSMLVPSPSPPGFLQETLAGRDDPPTAATTGGVSRRALTASIRAHAPLRRFAPQERACCCWRWPCSSGSPPCWIGGVPAQDAAVSTTRTSSNGSGHAGDRPREATRGRLARDLEKYLRTRPEVRDFHVTLSGQSSPMDFNGLVRHYYLRQGANVADVRVSLLQRSQREMDSHALVLRLRRDLGGDRADGTGADLKASSRCRRGRRTCRPWWGRFTVPWAPVTRASFIRRTRSRRPFSTGRGWWT